MPITVPNGRPNFVNLGNGFYLVRTMAGFRGALKNEFPDRRPSDVRGYPHSYPCIAHISDRFFGYHYTQADILAIDQVVEAIKG